VTNKYLVPLLIIAMACIGSAEPTADVISTLGAQPPVVAGTEMTVTDILAFGEAVDVILYLAPGDETVAATLYEIYEISGRPNKAHAWANNGESVDDAIDAALSAGVGAMTVINSKGEVIDLYLNTKVVPCGCGAMG